MQAIECHITTTADGDYPVQCLHAASGLPKQRIKDAMNKGAVWLTRGSRTERLRRAKRKLHVGDELHLYYDSRILSETPPAPALIADVGGYSVWNKPCGLRSQGSKWGDHCTITRWAEQHLEPQRTAFTVHRLDRAANGLILVAHSKAVAAQLSRLFRERKVEKHYRALVHGRFSAEQRPLRHESPIDGKAAVSEFTLVRCEGECSHVDVRIETGRKHQVRRHLAELGFPIVGDRLYGRDGDQIDLQLTACLLAFDCPVNGVRVEYRLD